MPSLYDVSQCCVMACRHLVIHRLVNVVIFACRVPACCGMSCRVPTCFAATAVRVQVRFLFVDFASMPKPKQKGKKTAPTTQGHKTTKKPMKTPKKPMKPMKKPMKQPKRPLRPVQPVKPVQKTIWRDCTGYKGPKGGIWQMKGWWEVWELVGWEG